MVSTSPPLGAIRRIASRRAARNFWNLDTLADWMLVAGDSVRVVGDGRKLRGGAGAGWGLDLEAGLDRGVGVQVEGAEFLPGGAVGGGEEDVDVAAFGDAEGDGGG